MNLKIPNRELKRKAIHLTFGIIILSLIIFLGAEISTKLVTLSLIFGVIISILIIKKIKIPLIQKIILSVERDDERKFPGKAAIYFLAATLIVMTLFKDEPTIIITALSIQIFADTTAALIGMQFGKRKVFRKKTLEGSIGFFIIAFICISIFYPTHVAIISAIIATLVEILPLDDNLFVPLFTAMALKAFT